jgi:L-amino acid N-acyltransferase YncA
VTTVNSVTHKSIQLRAVQLTDAAAIADIYGHHVSHGTASFDTEPPTVEDWAKKIHEIVNRRWPFIVAEIDGDVAGYTYTTQFRDRPAYLHTCENSIYVRAELRGQGLGHALLQALLPAAKAAGFLQMVAVIGGGEPASVALHRAHGFRDAGRMHNVGLKFGRWLDSVYMQRELQ